MSQELVLGSNGLDHNSLEVGLGDLPLLLK